jgi:hypothetical protein
MWDHVKEGRRIAEEVKRRRTLEILLRLHRIFSATHTHIHT